jgi:hypothetical protein
MTLYIYGEAHFQPESVKFIHEEIERIRPHVLVHELLNDAVLSYRDVKAQLAKCDGSDWCDPDVNRDVFQLAAKLKIPLIGCDLSHAQLEANKAFPLAEQFAQREKRMLEVMRIVPNTRFARVVVVVGDIHLRTKPNKDLGEPSVIAQAIKNKSLKADVVRCRPEWREAE